VRGRLRADVTPGNVLAAVFPGGTITGCPKIRCMEIIAELEGAARGAYTGSLGYLNRDGTMDLNILIRTMTLRGRQIGFRAGGGIVADSIPERELEETRGHMATAEAHAKEEREAAEEERRRQLDSMREERDAATADRNRAEAEAEAARADRDEAQKRAAAAEIERDGLVEARDRARTERDAWMARARAVAAGERGRGGAIADRVPAPTPTPTPEVEEEPTQVAPRTVTDRRTIQIGERPGPLRTAPLPDATMRPSDERWTPRLIALIAIGVVLLVVVLLLLLAF